MEIHLLELFFTIGREFSVKVYKDPKDAGKSEPGAVDVKDDGAQFVGDRKMILA